jgi:hypothetical protein
MKLRLFEAFVGLLIVSMEWLISRFYYWARGNWQEGLRESGRLSYWWLFALVLFLLGYWSIVGIGGVVWRLGHRGHNGLTTADWHLTPEASSLMMDLGMAILLWALSTILEDPLLYGFLIADGLIYLPTILFWTGVGWLVIGVVRLRLLRRSIP